jgi:hypothetical protein
VNITDTDILDSSYAALHWIEGQTTGINFRNVTIQGAGTYALQVQAPSRVTFDNVRASGIAQSNPIHNCVGSGFQITRTGTNTGWYTDTPDCGPWPAPQWNHDGGTPPTTPPPTTTPPDPTGNLAAGRPVTASSQTDVYRPANTVDGDPNTYWESANNAFPQSLTVDLGQSRSVSRVVLKLPPAAAWQTRTQTLSVLGSTDGGAFGTVKPSAGYRFDPASGNTATVTFGATSQRYLRLQFTGNTGWPAGQVSEFEVHPS